jgi:8-oxo-dGTP diphosphatase
MNYGLSPRALIRDDAGRILFLRRAAECTYWPGEWELTGGKPEAGEDIFHCLRREALEETGLVIEPIRLIGASETDLPSVRVIYLVLEARRIGGELRLSEEHSESTDCATCKPRSRSLRRSVCRAIPRRRAALC